MLAVHHQTRAQHLITVPKSFRLVRLFVSFPRKVETCIYHIITTSRSTLPVYSERCTHRWAHVFCFGTNGTSVRCACLCVISSSHRSRTRRSIEVCATSFLDVENKKSFTCATGVCLFMSGSRGMCTHTRQTDRHTVCTHAQAAKVWRGKKAHTNK